MRIVQKPKRKLAWSRFDQFYNKFCLELKYEYSKYVLAACAYASVCVCVYVCVFVCTEGALRLKVGNALAQQLKVYYKNGKDATLGVGVDRQGINTQQYSTWMGYGTSSYFWVHIDDSLVNCSLVFRLNIHNISLYLHACHACVYRFTYIRLLNNI